jgi:hypothetical protein
MILGETIGYVPQEYQDKLAAPLPPELAEPRAGNVVGLIRMGRLATAEAIESLSPALGVSYVGLVRAVLRLGEQAEGRRAQRISIDIMQGTADALATLPNFGPDRWHTESPFGPYYRELITSNTRGTQTQLPNGSIVTTNPYEIVLIDSDTVHRTRPNPGREFRSRLTVRYYVDRLSGETS